MFLVFAVVNGLKYIDRFLCKRTHMVVDCMTHAVLARYPSNRYTVGPDTKHMFLILQLLPERLVDRLLGWPKPYGRKCKDFEKINTVANGVAH